MNIFLNFLHLIHGKFIDSAKFFLVYMCYGKQKNDVAVLLNIYLKQEMAIGDLQEKRKIANWIFVLLKNAFSRQKLVCIFWISFRNIWQSVIDFIDRNYHFSGGSKIAVLYIFGQWHMDVNPLMPEVYVYMYSPLWSCFINFAYTQMA